MMKTKLLYLFSDDITFEQIVNLFIPLLAHRLPGNVRAI